MKLGHRDITETNPDGIDHRANTVFYASDKHSIKCYKKGAKKNHSHIVFLFFFFSLLQPCVTFIKCLLYPPIIHLFISPSPDVTERCVKLTEGLLCCRQDN